jgi:hypothetical protein
MDGMAIAALVAGIAGFTFVPVLGSILGVIFGIIALNKIKQTGYRGRGMAIAGIITGAASLVLGVVAIIAIVSFLQFSITQVPFHQFPLYQFPLSQFPLSQFPLSQFPLPELVIN